MGAHTVGFRAWGHRGSTAWPDSRRADFRAAFEEQRHYGGETWISARTIRGLIDRILGWLRRLFHNWESMICASTCTYLVRWLLLLSGGSMFLRQAERQFTLWTGRDVPEGVMTAALTARG